MTTPRACGNCRWWTPKDDQTGICTAAELPNSKMRVLGSGSLSTDYVFYCASWEKIAVRRPSLARVVKPVAERRIM